jgi:DNA excision repair protein ERCC-3
MVGMKRVIENKYLLESQQIPWGVCIADEVHKLPAETFQQVLKRYKFYLKIGLTATPYREDQKINNLFFMIGPKLYEENWLDLVEEGCLAKPYCV